MASIGHYAHLIAVRGMGAASNVWNAGVKSDVAFYLGPSIEKTNSGRNTPDSVLVFR